MTITVRDWFQGRNRNNNGTITVYDGDLEDIETRVGAYVDSRGTSSGNVDVTSYGAVSDGGVTDSSVAIQAAIDASSTGNTIWFPGVFAAKQLTLKPNRSYRGTHPNYEVGGVGSQIRLPAGATTATYLFAAESYLASSATPDSPVYFQDLFLFGNKDNIGSGTQHGVIAHNWRVHATNCSFGYFRGDGFHMTNVGLDGSTTLSGTPNDGAFIRCFFEQNRGMGMRSRNVGGQKANDYVVSHCSIQGNGSHGLSVEAAAGWDIHGGHYSGNGQLVANSFHLSIEGAGDTVVNGVVFESPGKDSDTGTSYCMNIGLTHVEPVNISNCAVISFGAVGPQRGFAYVGNAGGENPNVIFSGNGMTSTNSGDRFVNLASSATINATFVGNRVQGFSEYITTSGTCAVDQEGNSWQYGSGAASPASGTYLAGTKWWRRDPAASTSPGAICTAGGTPGTWKTMAALGA